MASPQTLLCIHRQPAQLGLLQDKGYEVVTATNGSEGLRLFMSRPVDAIVLEYHLGLLDGAIIADEIKQVRPEVPIVMLTDDFELPEGVLKSVDAIVTKADGTHSVLAIVRYVLNMKPAVPGERTGITQNTAHLRLSGRSGNVLGRRHTTTEGKHDEKALPFSPRVWRGIRNGSLKL
jgi:DNA-binding response OmpR family regulator